MRRIEIERLQRVFEAHDKSYGQSMTGVLRILFTGRDAEGKVSVIKLNRGDKLRRPSENSPAYDLVKKFYEFHEEHGIHVASPEKLLELIQCVDRIRSMTMSKSAKHRVDEVIAFVGKLFSYSHFCDGKGPFLRKRNGCGVRQNPYVYAVCWKDNDVDGGVMWSAWAFMRALMDNPLTRVRCCPYCNADMIYALSRVGKNGEGFSRSAFDHYFPQDKYPFLGLSLYNLIPTCTRCNLAKGNEYNNGEMQLEHPYVDDFHSDVKFTWGARLGDALRDALTPSMEIKPDAIVSPAAARSDSSLKLFAPQEVYAQLFRGEIAEIPRLLRKAKSLWMNDIAERLQLQEESVFDGFAGELEWKKLLLHKSLSESGINSEPLGKLTIDLVDELEGK